MNLDKELILSDAQTIAAVVSTIASTNTIDLGAAQNDILGNALPKDIGRADIALLCQIVEAVTATGAATVTAQVITSAAANLSSPTVVATTGAVGKASLVVGYKFRIFIPFGLAQRYLGMQYVIAGDTTATGKVTSGIVAHVPTAFVG